MRVRAWATSKVAPVAANQRSGIRGPAAITHAAHRHRTSHLRPALLPKCARRVCPAAGLKGTLLPLAAGQLEL